MPLNPLNDMFFADLLRKTTERDGEKLNRKPVVFETHEQPEVIHLPHSSTEEISKDYPNFV